MGPNRFGSDALKSRFSSRMQACSVSSGRAHQCVAARAYARSGSPLKENASCLPSHQCPPVNVLCRSACFSSLQSQYSGVRCRCTWESPKSLRDSTMCTVSWLAFTCQQASSASGRPSPSGGKEHWYISWRSEFFWPVLEGSCPLARSGFPEPAAVWLGYLIPELLLPVVIVVAHMATNRTSRAATA